MKANEANCLAFLKKTAQFVIPIYQRPYSWSEQQCKQLWDDLLRAGADPDVDSHFIGSVVYVQDGVYQASAVPRLLVIDGQQRLTTLTLLILALTKEVESRPNNEGTDDLDAETFRQYHLTNPLEKGDLKQKLVLTYGDAETLRRLVDGKHPEEPGTHVSTRVMENLRTYQALLESATTKQLAALHRGLGKLMMIDVSLDREHDDPQLIFESLNSTGLALSQADLIRNYVLMGLPPEQQKSLYEDHWQPMERAFGTDAYLTHFDRFVRHYLTMKTRSIPRIRQVYRAFKQYCQGKDIGEAVADLHRFAGYYTRLTGLTEEPDKILRQQFKHLEELQVDTAGPLILEVYDDFSSNRIAIAELRQIIGGVESYVFRRVLCDVATNTLNKTFASIATKINKSTPEHYVNSFEAALLLLTGPRRIPRDSELISHLKTKDIYSLRTRNYLLSKLENHKRKEPVNVEEFTIEHVLPQNPELRPEWRKVLGEEWKQVQEQYLHTIGNLTITGYNSELSDRPFQFKRDHEGGFSNSPLWLNKSLAKLDTWGITEIEKRTNTLSNRAVAVWPLPKLDDDVVESYRPQRDEKDYTLSDHSKLIGKVLDLFEALDEQIANLDPNIVRKIRKKYISYALDRPIVDVVAQARRLRLHLNISPKQLDDPEGRVEDTTGKNHWGTGDSRVRIRTMNDIEPVMLLIQQSYEYHCSSSE